MPNLIYSFKVIAPGYGEVAAVKDTPILTNNEKITVLHYLAYSKYEGNSELKQVIEQEIQNLKYKDQESVKTIGADEAKSEDMLTELQGKLDVFLEKLKAENLEPDSLFDFDTKNQLVNMIAPYLRDLFDSTLVATYVAFKDPDKSEEHPKRILLTTLSGKEAGAKGFLGKFLKIDKSDFSVAENMRGGIFELMLTADKKSIVFCAKAHRTFATESPEIRKKAKKKNIGEILSNIKIPVVAQIAKKFRDIVLPPYVDDSIVKLYPLENYSKERSVQMLNQEEFLIDPQNPNIKIKQNFPAIEVGKGTAYILYPLVVNGKAQAVLIIKLSEKEIPSEDYKKIEEKIKVMHSRLLNVTQNIDKQLAALTVKSELEEREQILLKTLGEKLFKHVRVNGMRVMHERREIIINFADLVGFTAMSEKLTPDMVAVIINTFFEGMSQVIEKNGAYLDKFNGDQTMVLMGTPVDDVSNREEQVEKAFDMAFDMINKVADINTEYALLYEEYKIDPLRLRIGSFNGESVVGNFGSKQKVSYTAIGDPVNTAARYQSAARPNHYVFSEEDFEVLKKSGRVEEHFKYITEHPDCDAYRNATIDDIFKPTTIRLKNKADKHRIRMVIMEATYPLRALNQIKNALNEPKRGAQRISEIIFGVKEGDDIISAVEKTDLFMIDWVSQKLSDQVDYEFNFDGVDEILSRHFPNMHKSFKETNGNGRAHNVPQRFQDILNRKQRIPNRIDARDFFDLRRGKILDFPAGLKKQLNRAHYVIYLVNYVWLVQNAFVQQIRMYQSLKQKENKAKENSQKSKKEAEKQTA